MNPGPTKLRLFGLVLAIAGSAGAAADVTVGDRSVDCAEDPACINRLHPDIPMLARAEPGDRFGTDGRFIFAGRDQ